MLTTSPLWPPISVLTFLIYIQFARGYAVACGQNTPPATTAQYSASKEFATRSAASPNLHQAPIRPVTVSPSNERLINNDSEENIKAATSDVVAGASAESKNHKLPASDESPNNSIFNAPIKAIGEKIGDLKNSVSNAANEARDSMTKAFHDVGETAAAKLRDSELYVSEKFKPLTDAAANLFEKTDLTDKQKWNQLVQRVDSMGLNNADKHEFYQKLAEVANQ